MDWRKNSSSLAKYNLRQWNKSVMRHQATTLHKANTYSLSLFALAGLPARLHALSLHTKAQQKKEKMLAFESWTFENESVSVGTHSRACNITCPARCFYVPYVSFVSCIVFLIVPFSRSLRVYRSFFHFTSNNVSGKVDNYKAISKSYESCAVHLTGSNIDYFGVVITFHSCDTIVNDKDKLFKSAKSIGICVKGFM